ncbi:HK97 family phage prohead protease [uncultured Nocardioides sp.]|jgi:HK97 family phage prohead protease|uniref:HK97 family phage prohead protease n=1 Tax=uncultured Nocardioides sp. TaxID=198441 RepID=UPI002608E17D|nr:HK97 family phage prohead protease [uncultured Nocardioides sp.]HRD59373.1 HK97 family phage prohead protease [Nocardioides sp.]
MTDAERRFTAVRVEVRAAEQSRTIGGYAALFDSPSQNLGGFREFIAPGAFNRAASRNWPGGGTGVMARYNHDDNLLLGNTDSGTLRLSVDETGLRYDVDVPTTGNAAGIYELVQRGDVRSSSFAFMTDDDEWSTDDSGFPVRTLRQVQLIDVAPVNTPAYLDTSVGLRSLAKKFDAEFEEVRSLADKNELVKFFKRSDGSKPETKRSAQAALARVLDLT